MKNASFCALLLSLIVFTSSRPAEAAPFVGKWRAVAEVRDGKRTPVPGGVKMVLIFKSSGAFKQSVKMGKRAARDETGTWKLSGGKLVVKSGPSKSRRTTKRFSYRKSGRKLLLSTTYGTQKVVLHLKPAR